MSASPTQSVAGRPWIAGVRGLVYGADYNPDQWGEDTWVEDAKLMREAGVNLVSVGVFSWAKLEPEPGRYDFEWLDRVMDLLRESGVFVNLATPTAAPPHWLVESNPEILPLDPALGKMRAGSRRHYCPHTRAYREAARRIVRVLAERYGPHPALASWHVDNEYGCHVGECVCDESKAAFRSWLERRYGTVEDLNVAWGTAMWGQQYSAWSQVEPPRSLPTFVNPGHELDWRRFWSDSWIECFLDQKAILREITPNLPVATNFMGFHGNVDYWQLAAAEDYVANDAYPETSDPDWQIESAMVCDLVRSLGEGRPWLLMEQAVAYATWRPRNSTKRPGVMRVGSFQSLARGADGVMFFQWRTSPTGAEMHTVGLVSHGGTDNRQWREATALGAELKKLSDLRGSRLRSRVALVFDWSNWWALETDGKLDGDIRLMPLVRALYAAFFRLGLTVDFVAPGSDISGYSLVVLPHLYLVDDQAAANLARYVAGGGNVLISFFSGLVDETVRARLGGDPAPFREMLGLRIEEFAPFAGEMTNTVRIADGPAFEARLWGEVVRPEGAAVLATFESDFYAGSPAVTRNAYGQGTAMYVATMPGEAGLAWLVEEACRNAGIEPVAGASAAVEIVRRTSGFDEWVFVLNHSAETVEVPLERPGTDVLTGMRVEGSVRVGPVDVAVIRAE